MSHQSAEVSNSCKEILQETKNNKTGGKTCSTEVSKSWKSVIFVSPINVAYHNDKVMSEKKLAHHILNVFYLNHATSLNLEGS